MGEIALEREKIQETEMLFHSSTLGWKSSPFKSLAASSVNRPLMRNKSGMPPSEAQETLYDPWLAWKRLPSSQSWRARTAQMCLGRNDDPISSRLRQNTKYGVRLPDFPACILGAAFGVWSSIVIKLALLNNERAAVVDLSGGPGSRPHLPTGTCPLREDCAGTVAPPRHY